MSASLPVVWTDGLFLRPQHLQQLERAADARLESRLAWLDRSTWGFSALSLATAGLETGHLVVIAARGVMPDGTPFALPEDAPCPAPLAWPADARDDLCCLALPLARAGARDTAWPDTPAATLARRLAQEHALADATLDEAERAPVALARLNLRLLASRQADDGLALLPVARVLERRAAGDLVLDGDWLPPLLDIRGHADASALLDDIARLLAHRATAVAARAPAAATTAEAIEDRLLLQALNRHDARVGALARARRVHPQRLHAALLEAVGELATFDARRGRRPPELPAWQHDDPARSLRPALAALRLMLGDVLDTGVVALPLQPRGPGLWTALVADDALLAGARFVLAARAALPESAVRQGLPSHTTVAPADRLRDLVRRHLPGLALAPLSVAPPCLPFHAGSTYFELARDDAHWAALRTTRLLALHVAGDFPDLHLELWALRP